MECSRACELISARLDRQIAPEDLVVLDAHLATCADCQGTAEAFRAQDADLLRGFRPQRIAAERVAESVLRELAADSQVERNVVPPARWLQLLLALAAGFLLAVLVFQPWKRRDEPAGAPQVVHEEHSGPVAVATLVSATGPIELRTGGSGAWQSAVDPAVIKSFTCPSGSEVRTGPNVACELRTTEGCVVRLNQDSEIAITSAHTVAIRRGEIWCSSPEKAVLKVVAAEPSAMEGLQWLSCPSNSSLTAARQEGQVQVTSAKGEAEVQAVDGSEHLESGQCAAIQAGKIVKSQVHDPVLSPAWVRPLLVLKGHGNPELQSHVDQILARIGRSKVSFLYEQQIRSLGDYGALPLARFVSSPISRDDPVSRHTAMKILSDLAPSWMTGDLIGLLSDDEPGIRYLAAVALRRLTGEDLGRPPERWREPLAECADSIAQWKAWWEENRSLYPSPLVAGL